MLLLVSPRGTEMRPLRIVLVLLLFFIVFARCYGQQAGVRSTNFVVTAPTQEIANQVAQYAEKYRKEKALLWLGKEMSQWREPCPIKVTITTGGAGGATSFSFDRGQLLGQTCHVEGPQERILNSVLPHEITHMVYASYFRHPVQRWCDEGGAVTSEDEKEQRFHDDLCRKILNTPGRAIPLSRLFALESYPQDVMALYTEGYCVVNFLLVKDPDRSKFLKFMDAGMSSGWDSASRYYGYNSVNELEQAWFQHMRETKGSMKIAGSVVIPTNVNGGTVPLTSSVPSVSVITVPSSDPNTALLQKISRQLDVLPQLVNQVNDHEQRIKKLEAERGIQVNQGWNQQPVRQSIPNAQPVGSFQQPFAQPQFFQPNSLCPPGSQH